MEGNVEINLNASGTQSSTDDKGLQSKYIRNNEEASSDIAILGSNIKDILEDTLNKLSKIKSSTTINNTYNNVLSEDKAASKGNITETYNLNKLLPDNTVSKTIESTDRDSLTPNERQRYKEIFIILGKELGIGKFQEGPEAGRLTAPTSALPTPVATTIQQGTAANTVEAAPDLKSGLLGLLAASGILGLLYEVLTGNISGALQSIYRGITVAAQQAFKVLDDLIKPLLGTIDDAVKVIKTVADDVLKGALNAVKSLLPSFAKPLATSAATGAAAAAAPGTRAAAAARPANPLGSGGPISAPAPPVAAPVRPPSFVDRFFTGAKNVAQNAARNIIPGPVRNAVSTIFKTLGGARGVITNVGGVLKPLAKGLPLVGPVLELFFGRGDILKLKQQRVDGEIKSDDELYQQAGERVVRGLGGLLGGAGGAALIGGLGTFLGGPVGAVIGAIAGGVGGDLAGRALADLLSKYIIPTEALKDVGKIVVTAPLVDDEEMQDFIIKDGQVRKFSNKDEVLGMKDGGAISDLLSTITSNNNRQYTIVERQIKILEEIRDGIRGLVLKNNNTSNYTSNNETNRPNLIPFTLRSEFDSMNNIATI